jgi:polygalacturonase
MGDSCLFCAGADERTAKNQRRLIPREARKFGAASLFAAACLAAPTRIWADPALPSIGAGDYNVTVSNAAIDGGQIASGNGSTDDTPVIQAFINYAAANGGGVVEIPSAGGAYMSNLLTLGNNVNLQIDTGATLQNITPTSGLITTAGITNPHDMEISGGGILDDHYTATTPAASGYKMLSLSNVATLEVNGVTIENSGLEHLATENDSNVTINAITIQDPIAVANGGYVANTDGIDYSGSHFLIENFNISDGDDDIVTKPGSTFCSDITIEGGNIYAGHGISIGSPTTDGLTGMTVENVNFDGTTADPIENGIHFKAAYGGGLVQNVTLTNLTMNNVTSPINISSEYNNGGNVTDAPHVMAAGPSPFGATTPMWKNISFTNININGSSSNNIFGAFNTSPIDGVSLNSVNYENPPANGMVLDNITDLQVTGTTTLAVQCGSVGTLEVAGSPQNQPSITQSYSAAQQSAAQTLAQQLAGAQYYFDPNTVNEVAVNSSLTLGTNPGSAGTYNLNGATLSCGGTETIGFEGTGTLNQVGGANKCEIMYIAEAGGAGTYAMNGGTFNASVGVSSTGTIDISGGAAFNTGGFFTTTNTTTTVNNSTFVVGDVFSNTGIDGLVQIEGASTFDVSNVTAIQGSGAIVMSGTPTVHTGNYQMELDVNAGTTITKAGANSLTIDGTQTWGAGSELNLTGGTTFIQSDPGGTVDVEVNNSASLQFQFPAGSSSHAVFNVGALNIHNGGLAVVDPSNGGPILTLATGTLTIDNDPGQLDLNDGMLIVQNPSNTDHGVSELASLAGYAAMGYNGGSWNGSGLMSSIAAADSHHATGIGILNNDAGNGNFVYQQFGGVYVSAQATLARETYYGDGLLTGAVSLDDFNLYLEGLNGSEPATWEYGDYTYTGHVDVATDFQLFAEGYYADGGDLSALSDAVASSDMTDSQQAMAQEIIISVVPEPSSMALLAGASVLLARRRRRAGKLPVVP